MDPSRCRRTSRLGLFRSGFRLLFKDTEVRCQTQHWKVPNNNLAWVWQRRNRNIFGVLYRTSWTVTEELQ